IAEIIDVHLALARLGLESRPRPCRPAESSIPSEVAHGMQSIEIGSARIRGQNLVGIFLEAGLDERLICPGCESWDESWDEEGALVGVGPDQDRRVIVAPLLIKPVLISQKHVAVENRPGPPETGGRIFQNILRGPLAGFADRTHTEHRQESRAPLLRCKE